MVVRLSNGTKLGHANCHKRAADFGSEFLTVPMPIYYLFCILGYADRFTLSVGYDFYNFLSRA